MDALFQTASSVQAQLWPAALLTVQRVDNKGQGAAPAACRWQGAPLNAGCLLLTHSGDNEESSTDGYSGKKGRRFEVIKSTYHTTLSPCFLDLP